MADGIERQLSAVERGTRGAMRANGRIMAGERRGSGEIGQYGLYYAPASSWRYTGQQLEAFCLRMGGW
jgi:hypothetical protein